MECEVACRYNLVDPADGNSLDSLQHSFDALTSRLNFVHFIFGLTCFAGL